MQSNSVNYYRLKIQSGPCVCGGQRSFELNVPEDHPAYGVRFLCSCHIRRQQARIKTLFPSSGIPPRFDGLTFDTLSALGDDAINGKSGALRACRKMADVLGYLDNGGLVSSGGDVRHGLYLYGNCGTGKTGLASATLQAWESFGMSTLWIAYADLIRAVQSGYSDYTATAKQDAARGVDLLLVDDVGRARDGATQSNDQTNVFDYIIAHRHSHKLATIVTSNLTPPELASQFDKRIAQRITELCYSVHVSGRSLRGIK